MTATCSLPQPLEFGRSEHEPFGGDGTVTHGCPSHDDASLGSEDSEPTPRAPASSVGTPPTKPCVPPSPASSLRTSSSYRIGVTQKEVENDATVHSSPSATVVINESEGHQLPSDFYVEELDTFTDRTETYHSETHEDGAWVPQKDGRGSVYSRTGASERCEDSSFYSPGAHTASSAAPIVAPEAVTPSLAEDPSDETVPKAATPPPPSPPKGRSIRDLLRGLWPWPEEREEPLQPMENPLERVRPIHRYVPEGHEAQEVATQTCDVVGAGDEETPQPCWENCWCTVL
eukprot:Sspe_Gene.44004::Locus_21539_Transcript_1_1_Confidence_1.000_Length_963::g.44004::m.44004